MKKFWCRLMFQCMIHKTDGQAFEDLFIDIMSKANPNFTPVKPQGQIGDRSNDGFDRESGLYYQVFAPEDVRKSAGVRKLKKDFEGLKSYWETVCPIRRYYFAVNDKYKGAFPTIINDLASIKRNYGLEDCAPFLAKDLERLLFKLSDDEILSAIGFIPDPTNIESLDYSVLGEVIRHIMQSGRRLEPIQVLSAPDLSDKIRFNGLGPQIASLLNTGSYQAGVLEGYFELNTDFTKQELRDTLNDMYRMALEKHPDVGGQDFTVNDLVFFDILDSITPGQSKRTQDAAIVLMAYFFESCDIFEDPTE